MKKLLLSAIAILASATAFATVEGTYTATKYSIYSIDETTYMFVTDDAWTNTSDDAENWAVTITKDGDNYTISNLLGWDETLPATYDESTGILSIAAGTFEYTYEYEGEEYTDEADFCGGTANSSTADEIMTAYNTNYGYLVKSDFPVKDVQLKVEGNKITALTPVLVYYMLDEPFYDFYYAAAYQLFGDLELTSDDAAIKDVKVDANAPAEYFNLQGARVANPAAGQMVIKRQGGKAAKIIL